MYSFSDIQHCFTIYGKQTIRTISSLLKKLVTDGHALVDYVPIGLDTHLLLATLEGHGSIDVTDRQFTLAYNPLMVGIVIPGSFRIGNHDLTLRFSNPKGRVFAGLTFRFVKDLITAEDQRFVLLQAVGSFNLQLSFFRRQAILLSRYLINRRRGKYFGTLPFALHRQYAAAFSFPRKVMLAVVADGENFLSFPIDLHGDVFDGYYVWGIRHSNKANALIAQTRRVVLCDVPFTALDRVYHLGKFKAAQSHEELPVIISKNYQYALPGFVSGYRELALERSEDIGSQQLFIGRPIFLESKIHPPLLHHVHLLQYLERSFWLTR